MTTEGTPAKEKPNRQNLGSVAYAKGAQERAAGYVGIEEASGLALGEDGLFHPIQVTRRGETLGSDTELIALIKSMLVELQALRIGMELLLEVNGESIDLMEAASTDDYRHR